MHITDNQLKALTEYAQARYRCLYRRNGFNKQAPNKYALRNRAIRFAITAGKELIRTIGAANGLCIVKDDVITCRNRARHYGVKIGDVVGVKTFPVNWFKPKYEAQLLKAIRTNFKF